MENGELTADGHKVFQSVNKEWHGAKLLFNDQYVKDHAGETKSFLIKTYVDSFAETTFENTAKLDYSYDNHNYNQESKAAYKNVNLLRKDGVVNQQTDQIDYTLTSYLTDISGLKAGDTVSIIDNLDNNFVIKNNKGSISAEYVSIQSQYYSAAIDTIHPAVTYDHNSHTFNYVVTQEFLDYVASKPDSANTDNRFGLRIKYSAVPENLSDFYKDNSNGVNITNKAEIKVNDKGLYSTSTNTNIKPKEILNKVGTNINGNTKLNYAIYTVTVNPNGIILNNGSPLTGVDSLNKNFSYILDSIRVVNASNGQSISEDHFSYQYSHENNTLTFTLPDGVPIKITYEASINLPKDTELDNNNSGNTFTLYGSNIKSDNTKTYSFSGNYEPTMTIDGETANLSVHKYDFDNNKVNLDGAKFSIYECKYDSAADEMTVSKTPFAFGGKTIFETKNGNTLVQGLHLDHIYKLVEVEAPNGYEKDSNGLYFYFKGNSFGEVSLPNDSSKFKINYFLNTQGSLEVSNKKQEDNKGNLILTKHFGGLDVNSKIFDSLKNSISFTVKNTDSFNRTISLNDTGWNVSGSTYSYELKNLPIGTYTVSENGQNVAGYSVDTEYEVGSNKTNQISVRSTTTSSISITNTYEKQTTSYSVQKVWEDNINQQVRPDSVTVQLYADNNPVEGKTVVLSNGNNWEYEWTELDKYNADGNKITYSAKEVGGNPNYSVSYAENKITNTLNTTSYQVEKVWIDNNNAAKKRPSKITVQLQRQAEGSDAIEPVASVELNETNKWKHTFDNLLIANKDGKVYKYTVVEPDVNSYAPDVVLKDKTFVITNTYQEQGKNITISKTDGNNVEIAGASMKITGTPTGSESKITPIEWVSGSDGNNEDGTLKNHVVSLQPGNYTLEETAVPDGNVYVKAANINFTVNVDGTVKVADNEASDTVTMVDYYSDHGIVISKQDVNGAAVKGALLKLFDKENNEIASWETDGITDHQVEVQPGTYTLREKATPDNNYVLAQDITFTVNEEGKALINGEEVDKVVMVDTFAPHDVVISKTDLNGKELKGAKLEVTGVEDGGGEIEKISWISDGNTKNISVQPGTYTLHEEATPDNNYVLAQDITFKVDSEGTISVDGKPVERVTMVDDYNNHPVEISKTDVGGKELACAQLSVVDTNGSTLR